MSRKNGILFVAGAVLIACTLILTNLEFVFGQRGPEKGTTYPHYTIVETQGTNLLVTDNVKNIVYYYAVDKDEKVGADLKLRGSVDLTQVGSPVISIKKAAAAEPAAK